jgi:hypothetical protein
MGAFFPACLAGIAAISVGFGVLLVVLWRLLLHKK